jgi:hypothetical protein
MILMNPKIQKRDKLNQLYPSKPRQHLCQILVYHLRIQLYHLQFPLMEIVLFLHLHLIQFPAKRYMPVSRQQFHNQQKQEQSDKSQSIHQTNLSTYFSHNYIDNCNFLGLKLYFKLLGLNYYIFIQQIKKKAFLLQQRSLPLFVQYCLESMKGFDFMQ